MGAIEWLGRLTRRQLTMMAVALAAVILLSVNMIAGSVLQSWRVDLTESRLFTITGSTRQVLASLDEPVNVKLYYSKALGDQAPQYAEHAERARGLLELYADMAGGKLIFSVVDPEPFSDDEDRAVAAGLQGAPLNEAGQTGYLGVVGTNSTDNQETIAFLTLERQNFLEYDLTKLIHKLGDPARKTIGLISKLGIAGGVDPQRGRLPAWLIYQQITELFDVEIIDASSGAIPGNIDVLLLAAPDPLGETEVYAIDQFALSGKPVVAFIDPFSETHPQQLPQLEADQPIHKLLASWGAKIESGKIVGDVKHARQVQFNANGQAQVASYVVWLNLADQAIDHGSALFSSIQQLVMASAGSITPLKDAGTQFEPLILTSDQAMLIDAIEMRIPDPLRLLNAYKPGGSSLVLAARLSGEAKTAFAQGAPKVEGKKSEGEEAADKDAEAAGSKPAEPLKTGRINVVLVSDADMLFDSFWAQARELLGQRFIVPRAHNADFLMNVLENVTGGAVLSGLRGRGVTERPFTMVRDIRQKAEATFRQREQALNTKLEETQKKLTEIQSRTQGGNVILSEEDKQAILGFRKEIVSIRKDLREVQRALRSDIETLGFWVKALNIAAVPAMIGLIAGAIALRRRRRRS